MVSGMRRKKRAREEVVVSLFGKFTWRKSCKHQKTQLFFSFHTRAHTAVLKIWTGGSLYGDLLASTIASSPLSERIGKVAL